MTTADINKERNERGIFITGNDAAGWSAISRDGVNMITFFQNKWTFSKTDDVNKFYTEKGFASKITKLFNGSF
jgi:hypothetical protein